MQVREFREQQQAAQAMAFAIADTLSMLHQGSVLLASGNSTKPVYQWLKKLKHDGFIQPRNLTYYHLDEFLDVAAEKTFATELQSSFLQTFADQALKAWPTQKDLAVNTAENLNEVDPVDLCLLGIGENGHIGFNEPGSAVHSGCRVLDLSESTREQHVERFGSLDQVPRQAIGFGIRNILAAKRILLIATGEKKARAIARALAGPISPSCPASFLRLHPNCEFFLDEKAAEEFRLNAKSYREDNLVLGEDRLVDGKMLFLSPHPDDSSIAAGGLLFRHSSTNQVRVLNCFSGHRAAIPGTSVEDRIRIRGEESRNEAKLLGVNSEFLNLSAYNNNYRWNVRDEEAIRAWIKSDMPQHIFVPRALDPHPAHAAVHNLLWRALAGVEKLSPLFVWFYETPWGFFSPEEANIFVPLNSTEIATKLKAIGAHRSQVSRVPYDYAAEALARLRAIISREQALGRFGECGVNLGKHLECFHRIQVS